MVVAEQMKRAVGGKVGGVMLERDRFFGRFRRADAAGKDYVPKQNLPDRKSCLGT